MSQPQDVDMEKAEAPAPASSQEAEPQEAEQAESAGFVEYTGSSRYGTEFEDVRLITPAQAMTAWSVEIPEELRWTKNPNTGRMLLPREKVPANVLELLLGDPSFQVVSE